LILWYFYDNIHMVMEDEKVAILLRENNELIKENNKLIKKIHTYIKWKRVLGILYWVIIIGTAVGLFYFLQPLVDQISSTISTVRSIGQ